jgi:hypothetical protein
MVFPVIIIMIIFCIPELRKKLIFWEILLIMVATAVTISISQIVLDHYNTDDKELWGFNPVLAVYDEPFRYETTCTRSVPCGTDSKGNIIYCTQTYSCEKDGGDEAYLEDKQKRTWNISPNYFKTIEKSIWKNSKKIELNLKEEYNIIIDGDRRVVSWPKTWNTAIPIVEEHTYENRTQYSTTMAWRNVSEETAKKLNLFEVPPINNNIPSILDQNKGNYPNSDQYFRYLNGILGPEKYIRIWVLIFRDKPRDIFYEQQGYWKNGNKNEFIICIGASKNGNTEWCEIMSWTEVESLKIEFRDYVEQHIHNISDKDLFALAKFSESELKRKFIKPEFTAKFKFLSISNSMIVILITSLIILIINGAVIYFAMYNNINEDNDKNDNDSITEIIKNMRNKRNNI